MDFNNPKWQARWRLINESPRWEIDRHRDSGIHLLNGVGLLEADYADAFWKSKIDAKWEKLRVLFFDDLTPIGWNE